MDTAHLREATRTEHEATEALLPLMASGLTRADYITALRHIYLAVAVWEQWAPTQAPPRMLPALRERSRLALLQADLASLDAAAPSPTFAFAPPPTPGHPEAPFWGALYVMEGSTLGGQFIARHLADSLDLTASVRYFTGHGERTGALWNEVKAELAALPDDMAADVIASAIYTFQFFADALRGAA